MRTTIGVMPPRELRRRQRLFSALEALFAVEFQPRERAHDAGLDAAVVVGGRPDAASGPHVPTLHYVLPDERREGSVPVDVELTRSGRVDSRLRGRRLREGGLATIPSRLHEGRPLAHDPAGTVWAVDDRSREFETALVAPSELELNEPLRSRLSPGRFLELLPLVHLLRRTTGYEQWRRPPPRAAFVFDDPNLHWPSYGFVRYPELARHARAHGYHAVMATVPLDGWLVDRRAARWFRDGAPLSLTMHGNDHLYEELALPVDPREAAPLFDQAIRRVSALERRARVEVSRVMVPPHEACSDEMMEAMLRPGIEAVCRSPVWWSQWMPDRLRTARWAMADVSPSGAPVLGRHHLADPGSRDELVLNLYLDQPAVLFGHHADLSGGHDVLADASAWLNTFDGIVWAPLGMLARSNVLARPEGAGVHVRLFSRRAEVAVDAGTSSIEVELPWYERFESDRLECDGRDEELALENGVLRAEIPVDVDEGTTRVELRVVRRGTAAPKPLRTSPRAVVRRATREARDRVHPLLRRVGLDGGLRRLEAVYIRRMAARMQARADAMRARDRD